MGAIKKWRDINVHDFTVAATSGIIKGYKEIKSFEVDKVKYYFRKESIGNLESVVTTFKNNYGNVQDVWISETENHYLIEVKCMYAERINRFLQARWRVLLEVKKVEEILGKEISGRDIELICKPIR
jgi:hypothetical protein